MPDEQLETAANTHTPMQHPLSVVYDHQGQLMQVQRPLPERRPAACPFAFVFVWRIAPMRVTRSQICKGLARARNQVPPALHSSTQALRVRGHVRVFRCCVRAAGLSVYSHTRIASLRLRLIDVPSLSPSLLSLFSLRRFVNGPSLRRRSSRAAVHALTPGVEPTPGETGRQGQEGGGVHRC